MEKVGLTIRPATRGVRQDITNVIQTLRILLPGPDQIHMYLMYLFIYLIYVIITKLDLI